MLRRTRILVSLGIAIIGIGAYLSFFGLQTMFALEARYMAWKMPVLKQVPVPLADLSVSGTTGKKLVYFGYEFEVPWDDIDEARTRISGNIAIVAFRSGNVLSVWNGSPGEFVKTVLTSGKMDPSTFAQLYGDEALHSDYSLLRTMLETTPGQITPFVSRKEAVSRATLLLMKGLAAARRGDSSIFAVKADGLSGFQFGRPSASPSTFDVELFSNSGSVDFVFGQKANGSTIILQSDINRIVNTLHKVSAVTVSSANSAL